MTENCFKCGKEIPFKFHAHFCDECQVIKEQTKEKTDGWQTKYWNHVNRAIANFFELSPYDQVEVRNFANHNMGRAE